VEREEVINRLKEIKAMQLPKMSYAKFKEYYGIISSFEETEENIKIMDEYFCKFLDPRNDYIGNGCWLCGSKNVCLSWGLAHGIAYSDCCGLSYKKYHYPDDICKDRKLFNNRVDISLQYHPDGFEINEEEGE